MTCEHASEDRRRVLHTNICGNLDAEYEQAHLLHLAGQVGNITAAIPALQILDLSNNLLAGQLPAEWAFTMDNLTHLDVSTNLITGSVPPGDPCLCLFTQGAYLTLV